VVHNSKSSDMVSVIIPTYKPQEYIYTCLNSLKEQSLAPKLFEIILVLNGCNEPFYSDLSQFIEDQMQALNVRLIQMDEAGVSSARNRGLTKAAGQFIAFIDDDDYVSPSYLKEMYDIAKQGYTPVSNISAFKDNGTENIPNYIALSFNKNKLRSNPNIVQLRSFFSTACCKLIDRKIIANRGFNPRYTHGEDSLFMALISDKVGRLKLTSENAVYYRRIRKNSAVTKKRTIKKKIGSNLQLAWAFAKIYLRAPHRYNFLFISTRIVASIRNIFESRPST